MTTTKSGPTFYPVDPDSPLFTQTHPLCISIGSINTTPNQHGHENAPIPRTLRHTGNRIPLQRSTHIRIMSQTLQPTKQNNAQFTTQHHHQLLPPTPKNTSIHKRTHTTISSLLLPLTPRKPLSPDTTASSALRCDAVTPSLQTYQHRIGNAPQKRVSGGEDTSRTRTAEVYKRMIQEF